ncbi:MAG: HAD-IIIA family hydrolase [Malacoplasma sp.]|nr:HAD-IIIA family hydrolase [Malacoplasma sp.]
MKKINTFWLNYLRPNIFVRDVSEINLHALKMSGTKLIVCDLDNTLVPYFSMYPNKFVFDFINNAKEEGFEILIASNNTKKRVSTFVKKLQETTDVKHFLWSCKKPIALKIRKWIKNSPYKFDEIVFIGDQFLTDILLANWLKAKSILVFPLIDSTNNSDVNFFFKLMEKFIYKKLSQENILNEFDVSLGEFNDYENELL